MKPWTESELNWYLERLANNDAKDISVALFEVADLGGWPPHQPVPTGNAKVIIYLEQLIEDTRLCPVDWRVPHTLGELRWLAARVLACEYAYQGIEKPIILKDVVQPIKDFEIARINVYSTMEKLVQQGLLPRKTEIIKPQDYADCCSKEAVEERKRNQQKDE